jgi:tRNA uridine 5-carboxymethylaminomethyl modification enzyme
MERLTETAQRVGLLIGCWGRLRQQVWESRSLMRADALATLESVQWQRQSLSKALRGSDITLVQMLEAVGPAAAARVARSVWQHVHADLRYSAYMHRQRADIKRLQESEERRLPADINYQTIVGLRNEARGALSRFRPATFGQAGRLEGVTPSDLSVVAVHMRRFAQQRGSTERPS